MKQLLLKITNCKNCPYSYGIKHKWLCKLSDKKLNYMENIIRKEIPGWCKLEDMNREGEDNDLAI